MPSNRSIRSSITILTKAGIFNSDFLSKHINLEVDNVLTVATIPIKLLSPKKSLRKSRLKTNKVNIPIQTGDYNNKEK